MTARFLNDSVIARRDRLPEEVTGVRFGLSDGY